MRQIKIRSASSFAGLDRCAFAYRPFARTRKRRHNEHRANGISHCAFSNAAKQRTAQTSPAMRRDDNQIDTLLCSSIMDGGGAVSGNGKCIDWNTIEIDPFQESLHLIATSAPGRFDVSRRIIIAAGRRHHDRPEISDVQHDYARADIFGELNGIL
jgi:hypothetical protein